MPSPLPGGELTVTTPVVFGRLHVVPVVTEFLRTCPEINIHLSLADHLMHLRDDHVDLAIRIGTLPDSALKAVRLRGVRRVVCASPAYLASHGTPETPQDLARHACISFSGLGLTDRWAFTSAAGKEVVAVRPRLVVTTAESAIDAAILGLGVTRVLSHQVAAAQNAGMLQVLLTPWEPGPVPVSLVCDGQGAMPLKLRALLDFASPRLKRCLSDSQGNDGISPSLQVLTPP